MEIVDCLAESRNTFSVAKLLAADIMEPQE
jgi:hypothetical protein